MAKRTVKNKTTTTKKPAAKKPIESYDHKNKKRANNPPVGLVAADKDPGKCSYRRGIESLRTVEVV